MTKQCAVKTKENRGCRSGYSGVSQRTNPAMPRYTLAHDDICIGQQGNAGSAGGHTRLGFCTESTSNNQAIKEIKTIKSNVRIITSPGVEASSTCVSHVGAVWRGNWASY
eukprot:5460343-Amphidinium_carterae.1